MMQCPMCGLEFDAEAKPTCPGCALGGTCTMVCCPRCGYKVPTESQLGRLIRRLVGKGGENERATKDS